MNLGNKFAQEVYERAEIVSFYLSIAMLNSLKIIVRATFCQYDLYAILYASFKLNSILSISALLPHLQPSPHKLFCLINPNWG